MTMVSILWGGKSIGSIRDFQGVRSNKDQVTLQEGHSSEVKIDAIIETSTRGIPHNHLLRHPLLLSLQNAKIVLNLSVTRPPTLMKKESRKSNLKK